MWPGLVRPGASGHSVTTGTRRIGPALIGVQRVCIVAERGMTSAATIAELERRGWLYILGVRMWRVKEARDDG